MTSKRSKMVTLAVSPHTLSMFPDLTNHVYKENHHSKSKKRASVSHESEEKSEEHAHKHHKSSKTTPTVKLTLKLGDYSSKNEPKQEDNFTDIEPKPVDILPSSSISSAPTSAGNPAVLNNIANLSNITGSKLSTNIRVGVSGLTMNPHIVRNIDTSHNRAGKWVRNEHLLKEETTDGEDSKLKPAYSTFANVELTGDNKLENETFKPIRSKLKSTDLAMIDNVTGVVSMKDLRGYKEHAQKEDQMKLIEAARMKGRRVIRSFTGYLMLYPGWRKSEQGTLEQRPEYLNDKAFSQVKNSSSSKPNTSKSSPAPPTPLQKSDSGIKL